MRTLSVISDALADQTGINPSLCYLAVLFMTAVAALVLVCALLMALTAGLERRTAVPLSFEKAKRKSHTLICWAGQWLHAEVEKFHFRISGATRCGKSLLFTLFLRSVISEITPGSDRRLVLFDPKNELHPPLFKGVPVPVHYLLPTDRRSSRWDLARDFDSPAAITQLCEALVPAVPGESSPYFTTAFRQVMDGVISSLNLTHPHSWTLADVVHILESSEYTERVLRAHGLHRVEAVVLQECEDVERHPVDGREPAERAPDHRGAVVAGAARVFAPRVCEERVNSGLGERSARCGRSWIR